MAVSDAEIIKIYEKNSRKGLELLYIRYQRYVYSIAYKYTGCKEDSLDITQAVFLSVFRSVPRLKETFSLVPLIRRITVHKCINHHKKKRDVVALNAQNDEGVELIATIEGRENVEETVRVKETKTLLVEAIMKLPEKERMAMILRHDRKMKYEEIAKHMDIPINTVRTYLHRAREQLRQQMLRLGILEV